MKKYFLSLVAIAAAMLFATSCQESLVEPQIEGPTTFSVQLPDQMGTKAIGDASSVTELLVDVYAQNGTAPIYQTKGTPNGNGNGFDVKLNLIQDQAYDILFWAQTGNGYVSVATNGEVHSFESLRSVPMNSNFLNNDNGAAFFHAEKGFVPNGTSKNITLVRPFAQLNLGTTVASLQPMTGIVALKSSLITVKGVATHFNVYDGAGYGNQDVEYVYGPETTGEKAPVAVPTEPSKLTIGTEPNVQTFNYVSMNYLAVLGDAKAVVDVDAVIVVEDANGTKEIEHSFTNVPVQENYRTNIVGNLISSTTDFIVTVDNAFAKEDNGSLLPDNDYYVVDNVAAANTVLTNGESHVAINMIEKNAPAINIDANDIETLYLQLPDADADVTVSGDKVKTIYISVPNVDPTNRGLNITINTPNSHVEISGQINSMPGVSTSNTTLVLNGAIVTGTIVINQGNVILQEETEVDTIKKGNNVTEEITVYVESGAEVETVENLTTVEESEEDSDMSLISTVAKFRRFAQLVNEGNSFKSKEILLLADLDLSNEEWTPIGTSSHPFQGTFDGNGRTIKNLVVNGGSNSNQGLFGFTTDGEIKNLVVENAKVSGRLNVGVVAGTPYTSKYTNIKVTGHVEVNGMAYVGGVAGKNAYANWNNITVKVDETSYVNANSVENGKAYRTYVGGVVGFNGEGGHSFTNITSNIDVKGSTCDVGGMFGIAHYGNKFENCTCSGDVEIYEAGEAGEAEEIGGIAGVWHNETGNSVTFTNCSFQGNLKTNLEDVDLSDNTITGKPYGNGNGKLIIDGKVTRTVSTADQLVEALEAKQNVIFVNDIKIEPASMSNAYGTTGINVKYGQTIDGNGYTLNIKGAGGTWDSGINTTGGLIKNLTVTGSFRGIFINHTSDYSEKVVLKNVTIGGNGTVYTISCDQGLYQGIEATNCTFNGWTSFAKTAGEAEFVKCSFGEGSGYKYCRPYSNTEFVNCTFCSDYAVDTTRATVTFTDCTWEE